MAIKLKVDEEQKKIDAKYKAEVSSNNKNVKKEKTELNYEIIESKTPLKKARKILFIFACIALFISANMLLAPYISGFFGFILFAIWLVIVLFSTVITFGIVWTSDGFKSFNKGLMSIWQACFSGAEKIADVIKLVLPYLAPICAAILIASLTLSTICFAKQKKGNIALFVLNIVFSALFVMFTLITFFEFK